MKKKEEKARKEAALKGDKLKDASVDPKKETPEDPSSKSHQQENESRKKNRRKPNPIKRELTLAVLRKLPRQTEVTPKIDIQFDKVASKDSNAQKKVSKKRHTGTVAEQTKENREVLSKVDDEGSGITSADHPDGVCFNAKDSKKPKVTFRDKFNACSSCGATIKSRIRICSGCKKVCYCDSQCQKSHWKIHKKECLYALSKEQKAELTG